MKKVIAVLSVFLLTIFITACGTTTNESEKTTEQQENGTLDAGNNNEETTTLPTQTIEGTTVNSDSQNYSITVVDGFELTGEEPNKDILFNKENDKQSMRIETFNADDIALEEITNNLVETLKASNEDGTVVDITDENQLPAGETITQAKGFQMDTPDGKVSGYTFESAGLVVKLTIFDTVDAPALDTFVKMAGTIKNK